MKKFQIPEIEICKFNINDIISTSRDDEFNPEPLKNNFELPPTDK